MDESSGKWLACLSCYQKCYRSSVPGDGSTTLVRVVEFSDRTHYQLQWTCPLSGRKKTKSSGVERTGRKKDRDEAQRAASRLEAELISGKHSSGQRYTWEQFRDRYEADVATAKSPNTRQKIQAVFNAVERILNPTKLVHLTAERLSHFQAELRREGKAAAGIKSDLATLKSALRWAAKMDLLAKAPALAIPSLPDKMKGRPITGEEFERMLAATEKVVRAADVAAWRRLLRGLWLSGLRIGEAVRLYWDRPSELHVDMEGRRPMLVIPAGMDKSRKARLLPITPDFAEFLTATPIDDRKGRVFRLPEMSRSAVSHVVAAIGKEAGVKVEEKGTTTKFASAHDLRRAFGERWSRLVMPNVLAELMRHQHITTTMTFYVGQHAERTADTVWAAYERQAQPAAG